MLFRDGRSDRALEFYDSWEAYLDDLAQAYHDTLQHYYDLGSRYVQLDDTTWAFLISKLNEFRNDPAERAKYEKIATVKGAEKISYKNKKLKKGSTYSYKVRAYMTVEDTDYFGGYSAVAKIKVK